jgi:hypothetical protein
MIEGIKFLVDEVFSSKDGPEWFENMKQLTAALGGDHTWKLVYERKRHSDEYWVEQSGDWFKVMENDGLERSITFYKLDDLL